MPRLKHDPPNSVHESISPNQLVRFGATAFSVVSIIVATVWFFATQKADIGLLQSKMADVVHEQTDLKIQQTLEDKSVNEISRKVDVAVAILERMEKSETKYRRTETPP